MLESRSNPAFAFLLFDCMRDLLLEEHGALYILLCKCFIVNLALVKAWCQRDLLKMADFLIFAKIAAMHVDPADTSGIQLHASNGKVHCTMFVAQ